MAKAAKYPKGYWTKVIGGYKNSSLQLPALDKARRPVEQQYQYQYGGNNATSSKSQG